MNIFSKDDVDKFFDKFEDPAHAIDLIDEALVDIYLLLYLELSVDELEEVQRYFIKQLVMKSYRLGRSHAYQGVMETLRRREGDHESH